MGAALRVEVGLWQGTKDEALPRSSVPEPFTREMPFELACADQDRAASARLIDHEGQVHPFTR
eukprot:5624873-Pyramimonas_sp.AAC.1